VAEENEAIDWSAAELRQLKVLDPEQIDLSDRRRGS
jgi:hypothetical protein